MIILTGKMKLSILLLLLIWFFKCSTFPLTEHSNKKNGDIVYEPELLSTAMPSCNNKVGLSCPSSDFDRDNWVTFCNYSCPQGKHYHCKEDVDHGILEFCAKSEICGKGQRNSVYFDEEHKSVVIKKDICPEGSFQPFEEDCYIACTQYHHVNESDLPYGIVVLYHGNATNAGVGYCDIDRDYVNLDYNMYFNLTQFEVTACDKKDNHQIKCAAGQRLLPNSRCTSICEDGNVVDKENFFKCSIKSSIDTVIDNSSTLVPSISGISPSKHITTATQPSTTAQQHGASENNVWAIVLGAGSGLLVIIIIAYFTVRFLRRRKNRNRRGNNFRNRNTGNGETIQCRKNYEGCEFTKVSTTGDIHIIHVGEGTESGKRLRKKLSTDTGLSLHGNENESDEESATGTVSSESGYYDTLQCGQTVPEQDRQTMMVQEMKSESFGSGQDENSEETQVLKRVTEV